MHPVKFRYRMLTGKRWFSFQPPSLDAIFSADAAGGTEDRRKFCHIAFSFQVLFKATIPKILQKSQHPPPVAVLHKKVLPIFLMGRYNKTKGGMSMTVYVCLDDRDGMLFNNRRQSRDARVLEDIRNSADLLTIDSFSEKLIAEAEIPYVLAEKTLAEDAHFFLENRPASQVLPASSRLVIYRWNRHYPADVRFDGDLSLFTLQSTEEFPGNSHETITKEVYVR